MGTFIVLKRKTTKRLSMQETDMLRQAMLAAIEKFEENSQAMLAVYEQDGIKGFITAKAARQVSNEFSRKAAATKALAEKFSDSLGVLLDNDDGE